jgi:hypothetical protein
MSLKEDLKFGTIILTVTVYPILLARLTVIVFSSLLPEGFEELITILVSIGFLIPLSLSIIFLANIITSRFEEMPTKEFIKWKRDNK